MGLFEHVYCVHRILPRSWLVMPGPNQVTPSGLPAEGLPLYSYQKCRRMYYTGVMLYRFLRRKLFLQSRFIPLYTELSIVNLANSRGFLIN